MKKIILITALAAISTSSFAEWKGSGTDKNQMRAQAMEQCKASSQSKEEFKSCIKNMRTQGFEKKKAEILNKMKQRQACVNSAQSGQDLKKCMPKRKNRS